MPFNRIPLRFVFSFFAILFALLPANLRAQSGFVHTKGEQLVDAEGHVVMLRGTNLGNWLVREGYMFRFEQGPASTREIEALTNELLGPEEAQKFWHAYLEHYITREDIQFIRKAGFNSIRVPLHYKYFAAGDNEGFALIDRVVEWSKEAGLYVILDLHCAPGGQTGTNIDDSWGYPWLYDSPEAQQQTIDTWKRIAAHYRDSKTVIGYDLLNEPIPHYPRLQVYNKDLEPLYRRIVAGVREVDTNHIVILGGAQWDSNFGVFGPPFDSNVMYNLHKYWMTPDQSAVQPYVDFSKRYHVPIWMSESGENKDEWIAQFHQVLEQDHIGWAFWPYKKMDATSAPVSFSKPIYWDEIVAFAALPGGTGEAEKHIAARPPQEHIKAAFADLLNKIELQNCQINAGYLKALGMKAP
jgi:aryl-phospho-beta-D-glucosidase BglC (GH1 family)